MVHWQAFSWNILEENTKLLEMAFQALVGP